ncbi:protein LOW PHOTOSYNTHETIC EFFICIENCY 1, chloroplastic [Ricinus communis]|uniref:protein LOW PHOTOSYNTHETIC EFFICIENCY 1, chloroplastic n=1 Tax=Ricinus communis TaxID=3988 RepID=UPI00201B0BC3|nr:protein LOW PHOTOSYNTHETIC EFFICIENCY 1, chloroplastic [Ricinus communis]
MQVLSIWPSKSGLGIVPQLDVELGSTCFPSIRRKKKKRCNLFDTVVHGISSGVLTVSSNSRCCRIGSYINSQFDVKSGFLSKHSIKLKYVLFCEPKMDSFRSSIAFAWALQKQDISSEFHGVEPSLDDGLLGKSEKEDVNPHNLGRLEDSDDDNNNQEDNIELDLRSKEGVGEEKCRSIDVRSLARSLHSAQTADDVEEVLKDKGELPLQVYSSMIKAFGWDNKMESALALVEWLKRRKEIGSPIGPNLFIYNSLLSAVKKSKLFEEAEKILNDMTQEGIAPNVVTYNTLMGIYVEKGQATKALNILEQMHEKGFIPTAASYSTALLAYRGMEDGHGALAFFVDIKDKYLKGKIGKNSDENWENEFVKLETFIIRICYQVMRRWLVRHDNFSTDVLKLLTDMDKAGLQPSQAEYERLVWACTREDHYAVGKELYIRIRERHSKISLSVCNHLIWLMGKAKKWWAALEIYEDLLDKGPNPNNMSYELIVSHFNILLTAARKRGIWRWGVRLLNKMEDKGLKPGSREWNAVLVACSKASETTAAVQIFRRMIEQGEKPTIVSYGALLSALEKGKLYDEAVRVWEHMLKVDVKPNLYAYTIMASVFAGQGKFTYVDAIIQKMVSSGIEPTIITYNAIISGCTHNNLSSAAYEWFHRMKVQNMPPNKITYEMLIEALAKDGKPRLAYELYLRAKYEGLDLSAKVYDAVLRSSQVYGATIDINVLGPRPPDKKKRVKIRKTLTEFCDLADVPRRSKPFERHEIYPSQVEGNK